MKRRSKFSLPSKYLLLIITILCVGLMFFSFTAGMSAGPFRTAASYVLVPIQKGINSVGMWFSDKVENMGDLEETRQEITVLQEQVDELSLKNKQLQQDQYELERLRELYELDEKYSSYDKVAARVIGKDAGNWFHTFVIDKGANDGLEKDMNVIASGGLVGIITNVDANSATVRSIIDDSVSLGGMVLSTSDLCIIQGDLTLMGDGVIRITQLIDEEDAVTIGSEVVTSPVSDKYLEGITIGVITELNKDANNLTKSGYITPVVDFNHILEVLVITELKNTGG